MSEPNWDELLLEKLGSPEKENVSFLEPNPGFTATFFYNDPGRNHDVVICLICLTDKRLIVVSHRKGGDFVVKWQHYPFVSLLKIEEIPYHHTISLYFQNGESLTIRLGSGDPKLLAELVRLIFDRL